MSQTGLKILPQADKSLLLQLSGNWTLLADIPDSTGLLNQLKKDSINKLLFDGLEIKQWDSGLLTWLVSLTDYCKKSHITADTAALPDGVERLLALVYAVPERSGAKRHQQPLSLVEKLGTEIIEAANITGEFVSFLGESLLAFSKLLTGKAVYRKSDFWQIIQNAGIQALPIVSLVSFLVGMILGFVGAIQLQNFGAGIYIADLVGIAMIREMGAIMTGIIMAGRTGAAYAAQIGTMTVNEEIDALETSGFSIMEFLVLPRMLALMLMMPLLAVYADLMGILGGAVVAMSILDISWIEYIHQLIKAVSLADFFAGIFMSIVFGSIVALVGCLRGVKCGRSSQAVGLATTSAVVSSIVMIVVACAVMTVIFNALGF